MSTRPPGWEKMTPIQQRVWQQVETERENLEFNTRRAAEQSERDQRALTDQVAGWKLEYEAKVEQLEQEHNSLIEEQEELYLAETYIKDELKKWPEFLAWRKAMMDVNKETP